MAKIEIKSPLPGTFYRKSAPNNPPYKENGADVDVGDVIGLIEVMKTFQKVNASVAGKNIKFLLDDADTVVAGQVIAQLEE